MVFIKLLVTVDQCTLAYKDYQSMSRLEVNIPVASQISAFMTEEDRFCHDMTFDILLPAIFC